METIQSLEDKIFNLLNENRPKEIQKPKKKKVQESSYEEQLLQSLQMINEDQFGRFSLSKEHAKMLFKGEDANLGTRLRLLTEFVQNAESANLPPQRSMLIIDILNEIKNILLKYGSSAAGFEMEYLIAAICGGEVEEVQKANKSKDVTDVKSGNGTGYSIKTTQEGAIKGSGTNFAQTLKYTLDPGPKDPSYNSFYYIILEKNKIKITEKDGNKKIAGQITFKQIEIVGNSKNINFDNLKMMYGGNEEVNQAIDNYQEDKNLKTLIHVLSRDGGNARKLNGNTADATPIGVIDLGQISDAIERNTTQFIERIQSIRNELANIEQNMQGYLTTSLSPKTIGKADVHLNQAKKSTKVVTDKISEVGQK